METVEFSKMSGSGNDFIVIDNRNTAVSEASSVDFVRRVCRRRLSVGADGVIFLEPSETVDFRWRFYNADGSLAEMCGNGARCAARFAYLNRIAGKQLAFETLAGTISAQVIDRRVRLKMTAPSPLKCDLSVVLAEKTYAVCHVDTGVPHAVLLVDDVNQADVIGIGRKIRYHDAFAPGGTNVNFVALNSDGTLAIRTYERGVEDETLACGTGAVAAALVAAVKAGRTSPVQVRPRGGGTLNVHFAREGESFTSVYLEGDARVVYTGRLAPEALE